MKKDIEERADVSKLVRTFYGKVREDELIGPIFNGIVKNWEEHLEHLTDFWEMVLLKSGPGAGKFNPMKVHHEVDVATDHVITDTHFETWLGLWMTTIEEEFEGKMATFAEQHAVRMAHNIFFRIMADRQQV
jgi:hemoglobin